MHLLSHLASIVLEMYLRYMEVYTDIKTYPEMLAIALFIIVINWKLSKCPLRCEWLHKPWYIHVIEYYPETKRNKQLTCTMAFRDLFKAYAEWKKKPISKDHMLWFELLNYQNDKSMEMENKFEGVGLGIGKDRTWVW